MINASLFFAGEEQGFIEWLNRCNYDQVIVLADAKTNGFCVPVLRNLIKEARYWSLITIPDSEQNKQLTVVSYIWDELLHLGATRHSLLVNLGGGVVSDMGGFAASAYKRGIDYVNIPTTLTAMVDASIGGKTGIDQQGFKNNIGQYHWPQAIYLHPIFLHTLSQRMKVSGLSEMIKHALIDSKDVWQQVIHWRGEEPFDITAIHQSLEVKSKLVAIDPYDRKERQALNLGHSIGHAIESYCLPGPHPLLHGEAIMLGLMKEAEISERMFGLSSDIRQQLQALCDYWFPHLRYSYSYQDLLPFLLQDKKNDAQLRMSLIKNIGEVAIQTTVDLSLLQDVLR